MCSPDHQDMTIEVVGAPHAAQPPPSSQHAPSITFGLPRTLYLVEKVILIILSLTRLGCAFMSILDFRNKNDEQNISIQK